MGILDDLDDGSGSGLLSLLGSSQQNPWQVAGQALSAAAAGYNQALADPRTRGTALGSAGAAAGPVLSQMLNPYTSPEDRLKRILTLSTIQKNMRDPNNSPEVAKLTDAMMKMAPDDPRRAVYEKRISWLAGGERAEKEPPELIRLQQALKTVDPNSAEAKQINDQIFKISHFDPNSGSNVKVNVPETHVGAEVSGALAPLLQYLNKDQQSKSQGNVMDLSSELASLENVTSKYQDKYSGLYERSKQYVSGIRDMASDLPIIGKKLGLSNAEKKDLQDFSEYQSAIGEYSAQKLHNLYGAALSVGEQGRANAFIPTPSDPPSVVRAKLLNSAGVLKAGIARQQSALKQGIAINDVEGQVRVGGDISKWMQDPSLQKLFAPPDVPAPAPGPANAVTQTPPSAVPGPVPAAPPAAVPGTPSAAPAAAPAVAPAAAAPAAPTLDLSHWPKPTNFQETQDIVGQMKQSGVPPDVIAEWIRQQRSRLSGASVAY